MKRVVQDLGNEAFIAPAEPEAAAATERDWKCRFVSCRMPATHMVTMLDEGSGEVVESYIVCFIHAEES